MNKTPSEMTQQELYLEIARLAKENDKLKRTKKFGLVWENKNDAKVEEVRRSAPILVEDSSKRVINDPNDVNHVLINGDNFQAMTALRATHAGKVDVIYIDPPYNTGNKDFIYNDKFVDAEDGYRHSLWLSFMQKRLILARELLSETGVIFVSIDDNEQARLKLLMDDIFGAENFIDSFIWNSNFRPDNSAKFVRKNAEYVLSYVKSINSVSGFYPEAGGSSGLPSLTKSSMKESELIFRTGQVDFLIPDGKYEKGDFGSYTLLDDVLVESGKNKGDFRLRGRVIWGNSKLQAEILEGTRIIIKTPNFTPYTKKATTRPLPSMKILPNETAKDVLHGRAELARVLGPGKFNHPKPATLVKYLLKFVNNPSAIVLDFFAGSGTTAHAVAELNKEDGGKRQCILITDGGKTETSGESSKNASENAVNIAEEITYERVKRVLTGKDWADGKEHEPLGGNLFYLNTVVKYVGTIDAKSKEPYFCPSNSTAFSLDTGVWHPILEEVGEFTEWPFQKRDYKLFALPKGEDGKQNYALTINTSDWEFTAFKEWFDKNMPEDSTVFLYADSFSHAGCEWMEELEMVKDPRLAEVNITKRLINNHNWVAHSFLKTDI